MRLLPFPTSAPHLHLCWLREDRPGHITADFASACCAHLESALIRLAPDLAPHVVQALQRHILGALPASREIGILLPLCDRSNWQRHQHTLERTTFEPRGASLIPAGLTPAGLNRYYARLLAAAAFDPCIPLNLEAPPEQIPAGLFAIWRSLPNERRAAYFHFLAPATVALQTTLRQILEAALFTQLDLFERPDLAIAALIYISSPPFRGRGRADFTHDLMRDRWRGSAFLQARRPLERCLQHLRERFRAAGRTDLLDLYSGADARLILRQARTGLLRTEPPFVAEQQIIDALVLFASGVRHCENAHALARLTVAFLDQWAVRLHRFRVGELGQHIPLLLLVATRAAANADLERRLAA